MGTYKTKEKINFTLDKEMYDKFRSLTNDKSINRSKLIGNFIKEWIEKNESKDLHKM